MSYSKKIIDTIIEVAEENDFNISEEFTDKYIEVGKFSPAGHDFTFTIEKGKNVHDLIKNIYNYYDSFDVSEETSYWLNNFGHGKNGAPYDMKDVYEDMECCKQYILDFYNIIKKLQDDGKLNYITGMNVVLSTNQTFENDELLSLGQFEIELQDNSKVSFDFLDSEHLIDNEHKMYNVTLENLDLMTFPDAVNITANDIKHMKHFIEFYIDLEDTSINSNDFEFNIEECEMYFSDGFTIILSKLKKQLEIKNK